MDLKSKKWTERSDKTRIVSHCSRGRTVLHEDRVDHQSPTWQRGEGRWVLRGSLQLMTMRLLVDVNEGHSKGMRQQVTRLEEAKGRTMRFVMEMVTKDRSFENSCEIRGKKENLIVGAEYGGLGGLLID